MKNEQRKKLKLRQSEYKRRLIKLGLNPTLTHEQAIVAYSARCKNKGYSAANIDKAVNQAIKYIAAVGIINYEDFKIESAAPAKPIIIGHVQPINKMKVEHDNSMLLIRANLSSINKNLQSMRH